MSPVEAYLEANAAFEAAKLDLSSVAQALSQVSTLLLRNPERVMFSNTDAGLPMDIAMNRETTSIGAKAWPTPDGIQAAIMRRFNTKSAVQAAWSAVPPTMQASLVAPKL